MKLFFPEHSFHPFAALAIVALLGGCASLDGSLQPAPPAYVPVNFTGVAALPVELRRVVLLPAAAATNVPAESLAQLDPVFNSALQQEQRFELVTLNRAECRRRYGVETFTSTDALPAGLLARIARDFSADAVMLIDVTGFRAYRPLEIGLRVKLVALKSRETLWNFDELFSSANAGIATALRQQARQSRSPLPIDPETSLTQSPSAFALYAAKTAFSTLPAR